VDLGSIGHWVRLRRCERCLLPRTGDVKIARRDRLGGVIHEYAQVA
jgi:hypothetical protein